MQQLGIFGQTSGFAEVLVSLDARQTRRRGCATPGHAIRRSGLAQKSIFGRKP
jgi:hypothetical protein